MNEPIVKHLDSGWILIRFSQECFAQIPSGQIGEIPDEFIFHPDVNRERINQWRRQNEH